MYTQLLVQPQDIPSGTEAFDRVFLQTVLRLNGVFTTPSPEQFTEALHTLALYGTEVEQARKLDLADDSDWLAGSLQENLAVERAFLFMRFDSVMRKTEFQNQALYRWLRSCKAA